MLGLDLHQTVSLFLLLLLLWLLYLPVAVPLVLHHLVGPGDGDEEVPGHGPDGVGDPVGRAEPEDWLLARRELRHHVAQLGSRGVVNVDEVGAVQDHGDVGEVLLSAPLTDQGPHVAHGGEDNSSVWRHTAILQESAG